MEIGKILNFPTLHLIRENIKTVRINPNCIAYVLELLAKVYIYFSGKGK